jgi:hypothetical protein
MMLPKQTNNSEGGRFDRDKIGLRGPIPLRIRMRMYTGRSTFEKE